MGVGIREPKGSPHVPGTATLYESGLIQPGVAGEEAGVVPTDTQNGVLPVKKDDSGTVVLVPQPSGDANDPLVCPYFLTRIPLDA